MNSILEFFSLWKVHLSVFLFIGTLLNGCDLNTPSISLKSLLFSSVSSSQRYTIPNNIPEGFVPTKLSSEERNAVKYAASFYSADGMLSDDFIAIQVQGLADLKLFMKSDAYIESTSLLGPIPGYEPGMSFQDYSDFFISEMANASKSFPTNALPMLRNQITVSIALLQKMKSRCGSEIQETCDDISYVINKYLLLREIVIEDYRNRIITELSAGNN